MLFAGVPGGLLDLDATDGSVIWQIPTTGEVLWPPLASDRLHVPTAFVGLGVEPVPDGRAWIYALEPETGLIEWSKETDVYTLTTPAAYEDKVTLGGGLLGDSDVEKGGHMRLYALDASDGSILWTVDTVDGFLKSLAIDDHGVYYLAYTDMLYGLDPGDGQEIWRYPTGNWSPGFRIKDGVIYLGSDNAYLHAVDGEDGRVGWRIQLEGVFNSPRSEPALDNERLYFQGNDNRLYAVDRSTGMTLWQSEPQPRSRVELTVGKEALYLAGQDGSLVAFEFQE